MPPGNRARFFSGDWSRLNDLLLYKREQENPPGGNCGGAIYGTSDTISGMAGAISGTSDALFGTPRPPLPADGFDLILSSETIYESESAARLCGLILAQLRRPSGVALVAAKSYYFGVGGSVAAFRSRVEADGRFTCSTVKVIEDGASNRREVLAIRWRSSDQHCWGDC
jgi:hypothetical protein